MLLANSRDGDLVARVGGDEFGLVLPGADEDSVQRVVERIERDVSTSQDNGLQIELAIGSATTRADDLEETDRRADQEMLQAKRALRNRPI